MLFCQKQPSRQLIPIKMKDKILSVAVILAVGCLILAIFSGKTVRDNSKALELERYNRITVEEKLEKATQEAQSAKNSLTNLQTQLNDIQAVLEKEKTTNSVLKTELEKVEKLKGVLEKELKEALVASPEGQQ